MVGGTAPDALPDSYPDSVWSAYNSAEDIVCIGTRNAAQSTIRLYWYSAASDRTARTAVTWTNGSGLPGGYAGSLLYVPEIDRFVWYSITNLDTYYTIQVPANPADPWTWTAVTITGTTPSSLSPAVSDWVYRRFDYAPQLKSLVWVVGREQSGFTFTGRVLCIRVRA